jgi:hypothetical protein
LNLVPPVPAALAGAFILLIPGLVLLALLPERDRRALALDESLFLALGVSVSVSAWLALLLAELGRFSLTLAGALLAAACGVLLLLGRRRLGVPFARPVAWRALLPSLCVAALSVFLDARPSQYIVGGRDPGAYVASMALIGRSGGVLYTDAAVASIPKQDVEVFFRNPDRQDFSFSRFMGFDLERPETGRVVPQFFHLFPAFGAYLFQAMGVKGALATPPLLAVLGTLAVFFALRRLFGASVALLGTLLLEINVVQVWFARYPVSEPFSQLLLFLGLLAVAHFEDRDSPAFAALAGATLGLSLLLRVDSVLIVIPLGLYVFVLRARGRAWRELVPLLLPFLALLLHAVIHAQLFASNYVQAIVTRRYWRQPLPVWVAAGAMAALALALGHRFGSLLWSRAVQQRERLRAVSMAAIVVMAAYAYFLRPQLSAWAAADGNDDVSLWRTNLRALDTDTDGSVSPAEFARRSKRTPTFAALDDDGDGRLTRDEWRGDPPLVLDALGFQRLAAHDAQSFVRLGWFVGPLGLALGLLGLLLALHEWHPRSLFPVLVALAFSFFYFYKLRVWNDYYFALRRFLPVVLPMLFGFAALLLVRLARGGVARRAAAALLALALVFSYLPDTRRINTHVDWRGTVDFVRDLSRRFTPQDVVIFEQPRSIHLLSLPLWAIHGVNALELARFDPDPERLRHLIRVWRERYRDIYFVNTYRTNLCGVFLQRSETIGFSTVEWERGYQRPPRRPETRALSFTISRVLLPEELNVPPLQELDVGGSDDFQVSGFFDKEGGRDRTYRWTGSCGTLYLPGAKPGAALALVASVGQRPDAPEVRVTLSGVPLGVFSASHEWSEHTLLLPDPLPPGPPLLRLDVKAFRPNNVDPRLEDTRDLGVMIDRVRLQEPRGARASMRPPKDGGVR